jgi:gamma-glutamyl phosphate reductase
MKDYKRALQKLRRDAVRNRIMARLSLNKAKRDTLMKVAQHLSALADHIERAMKDART